jgi:hypothetical protein
MKSARAIVRWNRLDEDKWERRHVEIERARKLLQRR